MSDINIEPPKTPGNGKTVAGLILLAVGVVFLLQQMDFFFFPHWLFHWPIWLIVGGWFVGARSNFRNLTWLLMVGFGAALLLNDAFAGYNIRHAIWPLVIIGFGIWMIVRRNHSSWDKDHWKNQFDNKWKDKWKDKYYSGSMNPPVVDYTVPPTEQAADAGSAETGSTPPPSPGYGSSAHSRDDYLDSVAVFGGVNKTILSKDFKGGEIVNIFGGAELDFTQSDIKGRVIIDITQVFGGTKIIVPSNWKVISDVAAIFASVDDKRIKIVQAADTDKILVLKGTSIFAGVDIRSY